MKNENEEHNQTINDKIQAPVQEEQKIEVIDRKKILQDAHIMCTQNKTEEADKAYQSLLTDPDMAKEDKSLQIDLYEQSIIFYFSQLKYKQTAEYCSHILNNLDKANAIAYTYLIKIMIEYDEIDRALKLKEKITKLNLGESQMKKYTKVFSQLDEKINEQRALEEYEKNKSTQKKFINFYYKYSNWGIISSVVLVCSYFIYKAIKK